MIILIKDMAAIKRELVQDLLNQFRNDYRETRKAQLEKVLEVLDKM